MPHMGAHANAASAQAAAHLLASHNAAAAAAVAAGQYEMSSYHHMAQTMLTHSGRSAWIKENELYGKCSEKYANILQIMLKYS